ncbi:NUDIX hydrolase [Halorussus marinus]|uniref:NUDIX hydrolase n=1 Tax=Halorussus marinus TaxID=2505976 RepID=UPI0010918EE4|nr:NUDIX hydrolase [Halorussus marinus]
MTGEAFADRWDVPTTTRTVRLDAGEFETVAAGPDRWVRALVRDGAGRVALVRNRWSDGWVLPGGKPAPGEPFRSAAVREVREETGLSVTVERPLEVVEPTFVHGGDSTSGQFVVFEAHAADPDLGEDLGADATEIREADWFGEVPSRCEDAELLARHFP